MQGPKLSSSCICSQSEHGLARIRQLLLFCLLAVMVAWDVFEVVSNVLRNCEVHICCATYPPVTCNRESQTSIIGELAAGTIFIMQRVNTY